MYEYSDSIECKLCGRRVILTDVELENHFNHCPGMADCGCHYLQPENPKVPIRQYSERHSTGVVLAAIEDSSLLPVGCIIIADGKTTMGELACSGAVAAAHGSKYYLSIRSEQGDHLLVYDTVRSFWHREDDFAALGWRMPSWRARQRATAPVWPGS